MRIDLNAGTTNGVSRAGAGEAVSAVPTAKPAAEAPAQQDTAQFLFDRIKTQALAAESPQQLQAARVRIDSLRKVVADGSYHVPSEVVASSIVAEARIESR